jgi:hypothetical protein
MPSPRKPQSQKPKTSPKFEQEDDAKRAGLRPDEMPGDVLEFITAIDEYKRTHQRPFPTWSEVLEVLKALGYERAR